jgi:hypothetical protein
MREQIIQEIAAQSFKDHALAVIILSKLSDDKLKKIHDLIV